MASSDMTAVAAMFAAVAVLVSAPSMPSAKRALVIGLLLGFAASVRITSLIGLVIVGLWLLDAGPGHDARLPPPAARGRVRRVRRAS